MYVIIKATENILQNSTDKVLPKISCQFSGGIFCFENIHLTAVILKAVRYQCRDSHRRYKKRYSKGYFQYKQPKTRLQKDVIRRKGSAFLFICLFI